jgi:hypothetical protein
MNNIFLSIFSDFIKNIDYYSIAMIINNLYENFNEYFQIVETCTGCTTEKKSQALPGLFKKLKDEYDKYEIEKVSFLEQFDEILSLIKDK